MLTDLDNRFLAWVLNEMTLERMKQVQKKIEEEIACRSQRSQLAEMLERSR